MPDCEVRVPLALPALEPNEPMWGKLLGTEKMSCVPHQPEGDEAEVRKILTGDDFRQALLPGDLPITAVTKVVRPGSG